MGGDVRFFIPVVRDVAAFCPRYVRDNVLDNAYLPNIMVSWTH